MAVTPNSIVTTQTVNTAQAVCTAAKTTYGDATNAVLLFTAGANGSLVKRISALARATVSATQLQLYKSADGITLQLVDVALMPAYTMAATTAQSKATFPDYTATDPLRLEAGERLYVGIGVALAGGVVFSAEGEDF